MWARLRGRLCAEPSGTAVTWAWRSRRGAAAAGSGGRAARGCGSVPLGCPRSQTGPRPPGRTSSPGVEGGRVKGGAGLRACPVKWGARQQRPPRGCRQGLQISLGSGAGHPLSSGACGGQSWAGTGGGGRRGIWRHRPPNAHCLCSTRETPGTPARPQSRLPLPPGALREAACSPSRRRGSSSPCWRSHPTRPEPAGRAARSTGLAHLGKTMTLDPERAPQRRSRWAAESRLCPWGRVAPHADSRVATGNLTPVRLPSESGEASVAAPCVWSTLGPPLIVMGQLRLSAATQVTLGGAWAEPADVPPGSPPSRSPPSRCRNRNPTLSFLPRVRAGGRASLPTVM